jgi:hypothetical protein
MFASCVLRSAFFAGNKGRVRGVGWEGAGGRPGRRWIFAVFSHLFPDSKVQAPCGPGRSPVYEDILARLF